jgi:arginine-tRNA-protein transferase
MKIFFSESKPEYSSYTFNYGIYCIKESNTELTEIYQSGFLPYSGNIQLESEVFYLARSLRVELDRFADTSENRRVDRKIAPLGIKMEILNKVDVLNSDPHFLPFCTAYASERIGEAMTAERLNYILALESGTHIFKFSRENQPVGYVLAPCNKDMVHFWFSFFEVDLMKSHSLGKWMMWKVLCWAAETHKSHVYLGTAYGDKALYKVRDHKGLAYFDGVSWNHDLEQLKTWCKADQGRDATDRFKLAANANEYINQLLEKSF